MHWLERNRRYATAWSDAVYQAWLRNAVLFAAIKLPLDQEIEQIVGYNPQRLLPAPRNPLRDPLWTEEYLRAFADGLGLDTFFKVGPATREEIEGGHTWATVEFDLDREIKQIVGYEPQHREPTFQHKVAVIRVADIDYALVEARILTYRADKRIRGLVIDLDRPSGDVPGVSRYDEMLRNAMLGSPFEPPKKTGKTTKQNGRSADYLKHDKSKRYRK